MVNIPVNRVRMNRPLLALNCFGSFVPFFKETKEASLAVGAIYMEVAVDILISRVTAD